jgi:hypothetical protein
MKTTKDIFLEILFSLIGWGISFALIYWLATDNLWLCFFISSALSLSEKAVTSTKRDILQSLLPIQQSIDDNINTLFDSKHSLESEIEDLKDLIFELQNRLDAIDQ